MMVRDFQSRDRRRSARADAGSRGPPARHCSSPASAAARTPSACSTRSSTTRRVAMHRRRSRRPRPRRPSEHAAVAQRRTPGRAARQPHLPAAGRRRPDPRRPSRSRPASTIPASAPSTAWLHDIEPRQLRRSDRQRGARRPSSCCTQLEGIIPALEPSARARPRHRSSRRRCRKDHIDGR